MTDIVPSADSAIAGSIHPATHPRIIRIFDTTLRDGEQSPGCSMNLAEKLEVAAGLADLGVDIIEAGFPIASPGDFEAVSQIARHIRGATICGLARCRDADIDRAWEAIKHASLPRIHVFLATSAIHRELKLKMSPDQIIERAVESVRRAASYCDDVEFSPEDASRTEADFLCQVVEAVIDAGATTINIPDTVGFATPSETYERFKMLRERFPDPTITFATHCHDDLGLAVANSLAAVAGGAGQIECTINGLGERAGNAALEEVVMAMRTRPTAFSGRPDDRVDTRIRSERLVPTSRLVSKTTGMQVQRNKAIVGRNAFAHESGIHQDGMLKDRSTYEIMTPASVGFTKTDLVLGKHSGRAALADRARQLGYTLSGEQLQGVFEQFKELADKKKELYDGDIIALVQQRIAGPVAGRWSLVDYSVTCGKDKQPHVCVTLADGKTDRTQEVDRGDGPIDAAFYAVEAITGVELVCKEFSVRSATLGRDALGEVNLEVEHRGRTYRGSGVSTDCVESTILAILAAVNRICEQGPGGNVLAPNTEG